ncbi:hypothetical protein QBC44DRAFT_306614 [Cladorrhinum sp. PSN332]|nr:hypothetical protein QBC44DRAFT_306614 [Cladorrhinum sp. PSN332]
MPTDLIPRSFYLALITSNWPRPRTDTNIIFARAKANSTTVVSMLIHFTNIVLLDAHVYCHDDREETKFQTPHSWPFNEASNTPGIPNRRNSSWSGGCSNSTIRDLKTEVEVITEPRTVFQIGTSKPPPPPRPATTTNTKPAATNKDSDQKSTSAVATTSPQTSATPAPSESTTESPSESPTQTESSTPIEETSLESAEDENDSSGISAGTAAGIAAGAVAGLALIGLVLFLIWRRKQGPIRGAVVTADYPDDMRMVDKDHMIGGYGGPPSDGDQAAPSLPDIAGFERERGDSLSWGAAAVGAGDSLPSFPTEGEEEEEYMEVPVGMMSKEMEIEMGMDGYEQQQQQQQPQFVAMPGEGGYGYPASPQQHMGAIPPAGMMMAGAAYSSPPPQQQFAPQPGGLPYTTSPPPPQQQPGYTSPPQRKLTAEGLPVGMAMSTGEYHSYKPPQQQQQQQPSAQPVSPLEERRRGSSARPVSAYLQGYPSPVNPPILPVSPLSTYYPDRQSSGPPLLPLPTPGQGPSPPPQISPYYPGANDPAPTVTSPSHLPQFMIPGGTSRSRAMSYSSQYGTSGGGMHVVGDGAAPAPPPPPLPSMPVMDSAAGEPPLSPLRRNPYEALR